MPRAASQESNMERPMPTSWAPGKPGAWLRLAAGLGSWVVSATVLGGVLGLFEGRAVQAADTLRLAAACTPQDVSTAGLPPQRPPPQRPSRPMPPRREVALR
jgi:hypothetical protein